LSADQSAENVQQTHGLNSIENKYPDSANVAETKSGDGESNQNKQDDEQEKHETSPSDNEKPAEEKNFDDANKVQLGENKDSISQQEYEEELLKVMDNTKKSLIEESGGNNMEPPSQTENQRITIHDNISDEEEHVSIPAQKNDNEQRFLDGAKRLVPGVKNMHDISSETVVHERSQQESPVFQQNREKIREKIEVEDVLDVPKEGSDSHEVSETLSFREIWNDPDAQHLSKTPPKLKRFDLKELLNKFLNKHDSKDKTLEEFEKNSLSMDQSTFNPEHESETEKPLKDIVPLKENEPEPFDVEEEPSSAEEQILKAEKHRIMHVNISDPRQYFWFSNGKVAKNIPDFVMILKNMNQEIFNQHVGEKKNDFANWIRGVFHSDIVANVLSHCKTKDEMLDVLE